MKPMTLYFQNSRGQERVIAHLTTAKEVRDEIRKFLDEHNFKSFYTRVWEENGRLKFDVGSHTEFFYLDGITYAEYEEMCEVEESKELFKKLCKEPFEKDYTDYARERYFDKFVDAKHVVDEGDIKEWLKK